MRHSGSPEQFKFMKTRCRRLKFQPLIKKHYWLFNAWVSITAVLINSIIPYPKSSVQDLTLSSLNRIHKWWQNLTTTNWEMMKKILKAIISPSMISQQGEVLHQVWGLKTTKFRTALKSGSQSCLTDWRRSIQHHHLWLIQKHRWWCLITIIKNKVHVKLKWICKC